MRIIAILLALSASIYTNALAQEEIEENFEARAGAAQDVLIGDPVTFDASSSTIPPDVEPTYEWSFGDGKRETGERVTHQYKRPGSYTVRLSVRAGDEERDDTTRVRVFRTEHLLLTDGTIPTEKLNPSLKSAAEEDILITVITPPAGAATAAEGIARATFDHRPGFERAPLLFVWTTGTTGTDTLANMGQLIEAEMSEDFTNLRLAHLFTSKKGAIIITDQPFSLVARPAQTAYNVLRPQYVLLARPKALPELTRTRTAEEALEVIRAQQTPFWNLGRHSERAVTQLMPWNALSYGVNALVNWGVPTSSIVLILMLPIIVTLLAFSRQVIGIKAFGIFTPAAVTLSFLAIGLKYGLIIFAVVLLTATLSRMLIRRFRFLYLSRMALVLTAVSFSILLLFGMGRLLGQTGILAFSVFPILILASLAEQFVEAQIRFGLRTAAWLTLETLLLSVVSTLIVRWETLQSLIVGFPELILLTIPVNILLGRWTGLRLTEYFRFRKLLFSQAKHQQ